MYCDQLKTIVTENDGSLKVCWCREKPCFLGKGAYGAVRLGYWTKKGSAEMAVAVKSITTPNNVSNAEYEIEILKNISHVNIVKFHCKIEQTDYWYIHK